MIIEEPEIEINREFSLATEFVNNTNKNIFLTGKAGSGKTTFLKHIIKNKSKNAVVVAPTGVAAINAGGVTIHSFFQLPFGLFVPERHRYDTTNISINDKQTLLSGLRMNQTKRKLFEELDLLIIDEVSMVRCDTIDAIDMVLRHFKGKMLQPFGGVQVLFIGDMYQLPPVAKDDEWNIIKQYYDTPYFFSAHVIRENFPVMIELNKIYRQTDKSFINVLNRIRNNDLNEDDIEWLQSLYDSGFTPDADDHYITLTTHNYKADAINQHQLSIIEEKENIFKGILKDQFNEKSLPVELQLKLKRGAQVMFIKNDISKEKAYYNGLIGTIKKIDSDKIYVEIPEDERTVEVSRISWQNIQYAYDHSTGNIKEEVIGSYTQFPLRLAWAVTIHKSQGLTFDKAIIDAGSSFSSGQVYVALSRCRSKEGIILKSRITRESIQVDERIIAFSESVSSVNELEEILKTEKVSYLEKHIAKIFDFKELQQKLRFHVELAKNKKHTGKATSITIMEEMNAAMNELEKTAFVFREGELQMLINNFKHNVNAAKIKERIGAASNYFNTQLNIRVLDTLNKHIEILKATTKTKKYINELKELQSEIEVKMNEVKGVGELI